MPGDQHVIDDQLGEVGRRQLDEGADERHQHHGNRRGLVRFEVAGQAQDDLAAAQASRTETILLRQQAIALRAAGAVQLPLDGEP